ncbi:MAG: hypothetical protein KC448_12015 [Yoonia sp.]|nr:hypothetical protein [Yoonia sp.]
MRQFLPFVISFGLLEPAFAQEANPLSAIDWLSQSVEQPRIQAVASPQPTWPSEPATSTNADARSVTVTALGAVSPDLIGLLPPDVTGLPRDLWAASDSETLINLIQSARLDTLPVIHDLMMTLLLAEADPPLGAGADGGLFLARVDKLLDIGALDPALALLEQVDAETPDLFRRFFDVALLTGAEDDACDVMRATPSVAPTFPARIFCLARGGDWAAAALTLNTHRVLGDITPDEEALISRFLDPDLYEDEAPLPLPDRISPLVFRMHEAIGEPLTTTRLPNAFAHADLRNTTGWKSQLDAAERLGRSGAVSENVLHGAYLAHKAAASGGVWDRVAVIKRLDVAVLGADAEAIARHLPDAWDAMAAVKLEVPFARLYAPTLANMSLTGDAADIALTLGLLSPDYEQAALDAAPSFLTTLATGAPIGPKTPVETAIFAGFTDAEPAPELEALARNGNLGEALLNAITTFNAGVAGDTAALTATLAFWRFVGLEDVARKAALQILILDRT